jgi:hypothetical protein
MWRWNTRTRRSHPPATRYSFRKRLARGKDKRQCAERCDKRPMYSVGHGTHLFAGYGAAILRRLGRAFRARKRILNYWLRRNLNGERSLDRAARSATGLGPDRPKML